MIPTLRATHRLVRRTSPASPALRESDMMATLRNSEAQMASSKNQSSETRTKWSGSYFNFLPCRISDSKFNTSHPIIHTASSPSPRANLPLLLPAIMSPPPPPLLRHDLPWIKSTQVESTVCLSSPSLPDFALLEQSIYLGKGKPSCQHRGGKGWASVGQRPDSKLSLTGRKEL